MERKERKKNADNVNREKQHSWCGCVNHEFPSIVQIFKLEEDEEKVVEVSEMERETNFDKSLITAQYIERFFL